MIAQWENGRILLPVLSMIAPWENGRISLPVLSVPGFSSWAWRNISEDY